MASCLTDWKLEKACETQIIAAKRATTLELVYSTTYYKTCRSRELN